MNNEYIDPADGKLDLAKMPKNKRFKLLMLFTGSLIIGISLLLGASHFFIDPFVRLVDYDNFYINKAIHVVLMLTIIFPLILLPFNIIHLVVTKTNIKTAFTEWSSGFTLFKKMRHIVAQTFMIAPLTFFHAWALQFIFGEVESIIKDNEVYFVVSSVWFSFGLFISVIITKFLLVRILRKMGLSV